MSDLIDIKSPADQTEGTTAVLKSWLKGKGAKVAEHDPVAELETDKVAVEISAPADGVIAEILKNEDDPVEPGETIARMRTGDAAEEAAGTEEKPGKKETEKPPQKSRNDSGRTPQVDRPERRLSPAVRRLVKEHALDPAAIQGTGRGGRITRQNVIDFIEGGGRAAKTAPDGLTGRRVKLDSMRRKIAAHMQESVFSAPHVTAVFEADFSAIVEHRKAHKEAFAKDEIGLTYTAYIVRAAARAMETVPQVNSRLHGDELEIFDDVNIGVGTALEDKGLIVPVIRKAQGKSLKEIAKDLGVLTEKARSGKLLPEDVRSGTFSISNHGVSGSLFASPIIINQPQSAILGIGKMEKRAVVEEVDGEDVLAVRPMAYVSLTIDHRVLDGYQTNLWLTRFCDIIENWED